MEKQARGRDARRGERNELARKTTGGKGAINDAKTVSVVLEVVWFTQVPIRSQGKVGGWINIHS